MKATMGQVVVVWLVALLLCTTASSSSMAIPSSSQAEANPSSSSSCQYYVSAQRGQDSNGGSLAAPFRSLQHALQLIINNGDLSEVAVCVEDGTYSISSANLTTQSSLNKTARFIGWDAQTQTAVWPYVDQIAINTYLSLPASLKLSFSHFEIGSVQDTGRTTPLDEVSFEECRIKGSIFVSYYFAPRATYSFVNCSWLPSLSLSNFSRNTLDVRGANLIVESSQLTDVYLYYYYRVSSLISLKSSQVKSSTVIITGATFLQNTEIHSCVFSETTVSVEGYNILISKCQFVNTTSEDQAVLAIMSRSDVFGDVVSDCVFEGNSGKAGNGGILSFTSKTGVSSLALYRNTFRHNIVAAKDLYGVINVAEDVDSLTVANCQFDCNEYEEGEEIYYYPPIYFDRLPGNDRYRGNTFGSCPLSCYQEGVYSEAGVLQCQPCPKGTFSNETWTTQCSSCPIGTANDEKGQESCTTCPPGYNALYPQMSSCVQCSGFYEYTTGPTVACLRCPSGKKANTNHTGCVSDGGDGDGGDGGDGGGGDGDGGLDKVAIAGIICGVIGGVLVILVVVGGLVYYYKKRNNQNKGYTPINVNP